MGTTRDSKAQARNRIVKTLSFWNWEKQKIGVARKVQRYSAERKRSKKSQPGPILQKRCVLSNVIRFCDEELIGGS